MDIRLFFPLFIALESILGADFNWDDLNLLDRHIPYVFHHQPELKQQCIEDPSCPFKVSGPSTLYLVEMLENGDGLIVSI